MRSNDRIQTYSTPRSKCEGRRFDIALLCFASLNIRKMRSNDRIQTYSTVPIREDAVSTSRFYASHLNREFNTS